MLSIILVSFEEWVVVQLLFNLWRTYYIVFCPQWDTIASWYKLCRVFILCICQIVDIVNVTFISSTDVIPRNILWTSKILWKNLILFRSWANHWSITIVLSFITPEKYVFLKGKTNSKTLCCSLVKVWSWSFSHLLEVLLSF